MPKFVKIIILTILLNIIPNNSVKAIEIISKSELSIDTSLVSQVEDFNKANSIILNPIFMPTDIVISEADYYSGIFYYETIRLNQKDFLSHYFVNSTGQVLQGNSLGIDQRIKLYENDSKPIIINFFLNQSINEFTPEQKTSIYNLLLKIINEESIPPTNIYIKEITHIVKPNEPVLLKLDDLPGKWQIELKELTIELEKKYKPIPKTYSFKVESIKVSEGIIVYPNNFDVSIVIKNTSSNIVYHDSSYEPIISKLDNNPSKFYLNDIWLSQTQSPLMNEGSSIKPNESKTFVMKFKAPLHFGEIKESYQLINSLGQAYTSTQFDIIANIERPQGKEVIEILKTETGQLNMRQEPWSNSTIIGRVTPGQRYIVLERTDSGFVKLDLGNNKNGWVVSKYTKIV